MSKYFKVRITKCSDKDFWYRKSIGKVILVKELGWPSAYFETKKDEMCILRHDVRPISNSKLEEFGRYYET
jgi:hypothetical protein